MKSLFYIRLGLDFLAAGLLLVALAYYWLDNATHEIIGTAIFLLLLTHNLFNRRWWGGIAKGRGEARSVLTKAMNLSLLITMLTLLVTSVLISQTVFSFLPISSTFTARQIHSFAAYWALLIVATHVGWHWSMIMGVVRGKLSITTRSRVRTAALRLSAVTIVAYGVHSCLAVDIGSKLLMQMSLLPWDFAASAPAFFVHHVAIVALGAILAHYGEGLTRKRRRSSTPRSKEPPARTRSLAWNRTSRGPVAALHESGVERLP